MRITCADGAQGIGYTYTIGTGGSSVVALLRDHLAPRLIGRDAAEIEAIWKDLFFATHATAVGAITSLALAAIDTALWDLRCRRAGEPLWKVAGGAQRQVPVYTTEGGWLHHPAQQLVDEAVAAKAQGFRGAKMKVGKPSIAEDVARLVGRARGGRRRVRDHGRREPGIHGGRGVPARARVSRPRPRLVRGAAAGRGPGRPRRARRARRRCRSPSANRSTTRRTSASISSAARARSCRSIARASAASRRGSRSRISPRRSTSPVCPHFLMELHVSLSAAVPERRVGGVHSPARRRSRRRAWRWPTATPSRPATPGLGIDWDFAAIERRAVARADDAADAEGARHAHPQPRSPSACTRTTTSSSPARSSSAARSCSTRRSRSSGLVPPGHKVATRAITSGEPVKRYNQIIGFASPRHRAGRARAPATTSRWASFDRDYAFGADAKPTQYVDAAGDVRGHRRAPTGASRRATTSASCRR